MLEIDLSCSLPYFSVPCISHPDIYPVVYICSKAPIASFHHHKMLIDSVSAFSKMIFLDMTALMASRHSYQLHNQDPVGLELGTTQIILLQSLVFLKSVFTILIKFILLEKKPTTVNFELWKSYLKSSLIPGIGLIHYILMISCKARSQ